MRSLVRLLAAIAALSTAAVVRAQEEWPRFHVGVAIGNPHWRADISDGGLPFPDSIVEGNRLAKPDTGWKLVAGYRPLRAVGIELQGVYFGAGRSDVYAGTFFLTNAGGPGRPFKVWERETHLEAKPKAQVLSALLFVPEGLPRVDVYGKVGIAHLEESASALANECALRGRTHDPCSFRSRVDETGSAPYVGIGARLRVGRFLGVRLEYESIDSHVWSETRMLSAGIAWER